MQRRGRAAWRKDGRHAAAAAGLLLTLAALAPPPLRAEQRAVPLPLPEPLVYLRDIDPSILQDMRYAGANNFTGRRVPGYHAGECVLRRDAAEALAHVQQALKPRKLSLKVYDCYRPRRAVRAFVSWVKDDRAGADPLLRRFHPNVERSQLIDLGYIAAVSRHSLGDTVDLTLVELPAKRSPAFLRNVLYGPCTGPAWDRAPDASVDMGTGFDCFDPQSHTAAPDITPRQRRWRRTLLEAMARQGFRNYSREWWHFTLLPMRPGRGFNVPIVPRRP